MRRLLLAATPLLILLLVWGAIGCGEEVTPSPTVTATPVSTPTATVGPTATTTPSATATVGPSPTATTGPTATPGGTATATPTGTSTPAPTPSGAAKPEGHLRVAVGEVETGLDPMMGSVKLKVPTFPMYDFLVGASSDGKLSTETGLANKWEHSADYSTWTFYIREGVKFHNGDDLTAEDVKFSLEQLDDPETRASFAKQISANFEEIVVDGPYQVTVKLKNSNLFLDWELSPHRGNEGTVRPKKYIEANGLDYFRNNPIGSGPYRFGSLKAGPIITYEAMDNHFTGVPRYKTVTLYQIPEEITRIAMLKRGDADVIDTSIGNIPGLKGDGFKILRPSEGSRISVYYIVQSGPSNPLSDRRVRLALDLAIDKESLLNNLFMGEGELVGTKEAYPLELGSIPDVPVRHYDPEQAKALLAEAGYPHAFAKPVINIYTYPKVGVAEWMPMLEAIASYWMKVGVQVKMIPTDYVNFRSKLVGRTLDNAVYFVDYVGTPLAGAGKSIERSVPPGTYAFRSDPPDLGYDALLDEQAAAKTVEEWTAATTKLFQYADEESHYAALFEVKRVYAATQDVPDYDPGAYYYDHVNVRDLTKR